MDENINLIADEVADPPVEDTSSDPVPFKILKGTKANFNLLNGIYNEGTMYYCTDTGELFIAQKVDENQVQPQIKEIGRVGKDFRINGNVIVELQGEIFNDYVSNRASGLYSHAEGTSTIASGDQSHAEGAGTTASGIESHAEGLATQASGNWSHAEGRQTVASKQTSHAEGYKTTASGNYSHAEGHTTTASNSSSHAEGNYTTASGTRSHAEGYYTTASGTQSHAEGYYTTASGSNQHVQGKYNISDTTSAHIVGNGTSTSNRKNAHTLDWDGNAWFAGNVYVGSADGKNKDEGSKQLATTDIVTTSVNGLMSSSDKTKLDATNIVYAECQTAAAIAAKEITIIGNSNWTLPAGSVIIVTFSETNTAANPTFNVNGTGAKNIFYDNTQITTNNLHIAGYSNKPMTFIYDGTQYIFAEDTNASLGQGYGTCATAAATAAKEVTLSNYTLTKGGVVAIKFTYAVPASATMNINRTGAKPIYYKGKQITDGIICAGEVATFMYDGTNYHLLNVDRNRFYTTLVPMGIAITANEDLNTLKYLKVGNYYCSSNAVTKTLLNCPTVTTASDGTKNGVAFMMTVSSPLSQTVDDESGTWKYRFRTLQAYNGPEYTQYCYSNGTAGNWIYGPWYKTIKTNDFNTKMDKANPTGTGSFSLNRKVNTDVGDYSFAEGYNTTASGDYGSHAEGYSTVASGDYGSHAEGYNTTASGGCSHAEGANTTASGNNGAHAEGLGSNASGVASHAEGSGAVAYGAASHAEGNGTMASGENSHAEGYDTTASGFVSHAEGSDTIASGTYSHAEGGGNTTASGNCSHAEGYGTTANSKSQHVQGEYNILDIENANSRGTYAHIVGNGTASTRSNAHTLNWDGTAWFKGDVYVGGTGQPTEDNPTTGATKLVTETQLNSLIHIGDSSTTPPEGAVLWINPNSGLKYWNGSAWDIVPVSFK